MQQPGQNTTQPPRRTAVPAAILLLLLTVGSTACHHRRIEIIDLDKVLTIFSNLLKKPIDPAQTDKVEIEAEANGKVPTLAQSQEKAELTTRFLEQFAAALNEAKLMSTRIGVRLDGNGSLLGFSDYNGDGRKSGSDRDLFRIEVDADTGRVIATDMQRSQYRRDHHYHGYYHGYGYHHGGGGFWMGYMLGSMGGRSDRYYDSPSRRRPNYSAMSMAPQGYHTSALQTARTRARARSRSSARSRGGSRSFRSGK